MAVKGKGFRHDVVEKAKEEGVVVEALKADNPEAPATPKPVFNGKLLAA
jgi:hypothetical protein